MKVLYSGYRVLLNEVILFCDKMRLPLPLYLLANNIYEGD